MSKRCVRSVPALLLGVVAAASLATVTDVRAQTAAQAAEPVAEAGVQVAQAAADSCLSAPKGATPSGSHWYYRLDRVTRRQCWYLREESEKADDRFARAAPPESAPASAVAETSPTRSATRKNFADARAEWQPRAEPAPAPRAEPRTGAAAAQNGAMPNVLAPAPLSSMRWNDAPTAASAPTRSAGLQLAAAAVPASQLPQPVDVQQPAVEQITPVAAEPMPAKPTASLQMLLLVIAAALALAGLTVSAMVRIGRIRARRAMRRKRRAMWDSARTRRSAQPMFHDEDAAPRRQVAAQPARPPQQPRVAQQTRVVQERPRPPRERPRAPQERVRTPQERVRVPQERSYVAQDRDQQVSEMLARLARSAQN